MSFVGRVAGVNMINARARCESYFPEHLAQDAGQNTLLQCDLQRVEVNRNDYVLAVMYCKRVAKNQSKAFATE